MTDWEQKYRSLKVLLNDLCQEWNEDCEKSCDSYAHAEECRNVNLSEAKKFMRLKIESLESELASARAEAKEMKLFCSEWIQKYHDTQSKADQLVEALESVWHEGVCAGALKEKVGQALKAWGSEGERE